MSTRKTLALAGADLSDRCAERLRTLGFDVRILPPCESLGEGVDTHADLMLFLLDGNIFIYDSVARALPWLRAEAEERGYRIVRMSGAPQKKYPLDIGANCLRVGNVIFSKLDYSAAEIKEYAEASGYILINVNQGYARCTACPVGERAVITADPSIVRAAEARGIEVLRISEGSVRLRGFEHGFIGGACGVFEDKIFFAGDLLGHPDAELIANFCRERGVEPVSLSDEPLRDVGSIFFI